MLSAVISLSLVSCSKEGPMGPAGTDGIDGTDGTDGTPGVDANTFCIDCHSAVKMNGIVAAFDATPHVEGSSWGRGTSVDCARCHASEGFITFLRTGSSIAQPAGNLHLECGTCHSSHSNLEEGLTAPMREVGEVKAIVDATGLTFFNNGGGNLCATCHQSRVTGAAMDNILVDATYTRKFTGTDIPFYTNAAVGPNGSITLNGTSDTLTVVFDVPVATHVYTSSTRVGPHHGPQANTIAGITGYPTSGVAFTRDGHTDCTVCHLNDKDGEGSSHNFLPNIDKCNLCHTSNGVNLATIQSDFQIRVDACVTKLAELNMIKIIDGSTSNFSISSINPLYASNTRSQFQALFNIFSVLEDKSMGLHNKTYTDQMLDVAEAGLGLK